MKTEVGRFTATDPHGNSRTVRILAKVIDTSTLQGPGRMLSGLKELVLDDGSHVNRLDQGKYQVVQTGEILTSTDPNAP